ncbi:MAG: hypothetical protein M1136_05865 [Chloroflexi bacterium]|nr:hypothetical protein [Chloroflexota bacterium]MCL5075164.1 hypothetical protein [Chloroflexota bacterium]
MSDKVALLVFVGGEFATPVERMVFHAQQAIALDTIERAIACGLCDPLIVATDSPDLAQRLVDWPVTIAFDTGQFHFGDTLRRLIRRYELEHPFYIGGGAAPLLTAKEMAEICRLLLTNDGVVIPNNLFSADFVAFTPGTAIEHIPLPYNDNNLAFLLERVGALRSLPLSPTAGTLFDIDTPTDLMVLQTHPGIGRHTAAYLGGLRLDASRLEAAAAVLKSQEKQVVVAGRVGAHLWSRLEKDCACRTRIYSEERGMRASGREERGEVRSLLGFYLQGVGIAGFLAALTELGDAAFLDSRVLFAHLGLQPSRADRFYSDLLQPENIVDPFVREFTAAARAAAIPIILGGHSLVSGGLLALIEAAWAEASHPVGTPANSEE